MPFFSNSNTMTTAIHNINRSRNNKAHSKIVNSGSIIVKYRLLEQVERIHNITKEQKTERYLIIYYVLYKDIYVRDHVRRKERINFKCGKKFVLITQQDRNSVQGASHRSAQL